MRGQRRLVLGSTRRRIADISRQWQPGHQPAGAQVGARQPLAWTRPADLARPASLKASSPRPTAFNHLSRSRRCFLPVSGDYFIKMFK